MKWAIEDFNNVSVAGTCADGWDQAMMKFDICNFPNRKEWKIFLQCGLILFYARLHLSQWDFFI